MKKLFVIDKNKTLILICIAAVLLFAHAYHLFFSHYRLQSPIILQSPVAPKIISPVPIGYINSEPAVRMVPREELIEETKDLPDYCPDDVGYQPYGPCVSEITPTPVTTGPQSYVIEKIHQVFGDDAEIAIAVAKAENTTMQHDRWSYSGCCVGIFQIHTVHKEKFNGRPMHDVDANIEVAYEIFQAQGWSPWEAYTNGAYLKHL